METLDRPQLPHDQGQTLDVTPTVSTATPTETNVVVLPSGPRRRFASAVQKARLGRGWTMRILSEATGISVGTLSRVEAAAVPLGFDDTVRLVVVLGLDFAKVVYGQKAAPRVSVRASGTR